MDLQLGTLAILERGCNGAQKDEQKEKNGRQPR